MSLVSDCISICLLNSHLDVSRELKRQCAPAPHHSPVFSGSVNGNTAHPVVQTRKGAFSLNSSLPQFPYLVN